MTDYSKGKIYRIYNTVTDDIYIGSTTQFLGNRMADHRAKHRRFKETTSRLYNNMAEIGVDKFFIELVEKYPCQTKEELNAREGHYIRQIGNLNKKIPDRTIKQYNDDHKEQRKEYIQIHKEKIKEQLAEWYLENKEKVLQKQGVRCLCECGRYYTACHVNRHRRTKIHLKFVENNINNNI